MPTQTGQILPHAIAAAICRIGLMVDGGVGSGHDDVPCTVRDESRWLYWHTLVELAVGEQG